MKKKTLKIASFLACFMIFGITQVEATPANPNFEDDVFYEAIVNNLNQSNFNNIDDRDYDYEVTRRRIRKY